MYIKTIEGERWDGWEGWEKVEVRERIDPNASAPAAAAVFRFSITYRHKTYARREREESCCRLLLPADTLSLFSSAAAAWSWRFMFWELPTSAVWRGDAASCRHAAALLSVYSSVSPPGAPPPRCSPLFMMPLPFLFIFLSYYYFQALFAFFCFELIYILSLFSGNQN